MAASGCLDSPIIEASTEMPAALGSSEVVREAHELLLQTHDGQRQKVNGRPYVEHPMLVATDVAAEGFEPEMVAAALLHDIVEDSDVTVDDVRERFGDRVADLVDVMTDTAEVSDYERRKEIHRRRVSAAGPEAAAIFAADKLNNVRALRAAYEVDGEEVAQRFNQPLDVKLCVWVADVEFVSGHAAAVPYAQTLSDEVAGLQEDRLKPPRPRRG
jgi:(p)ppGpp synthase/HD superfamily hydrolase